MALATGLRFGGYDILGPLGVGGMGEVYRARNTRLNREVALKVLPEAFSVDPDRLARFTREAHVLASLNHPNIAAIYGSRMASERLCWSWLKGQHWRNGSRRVRCRSMRRSRLRNRSSRR